MTDAPGDGNPTPPAAAIPNGAETYPNTLRIPLR